LSEKTIKAYSIDLAQFQRYTGKLESITTKANIMNYITYLHKNYQPKSVKRKLASIKAFFNYLEFEEMILENPLQKIKTKFKEPQMLPQTIPLRTIKKIFSAVYDELTQAQTVFASRAALRDVAVIELLFATGVRVSELCSLDVNDVNLDDGSIRIMGKGAKERVLQIGNREVLCALRQYKKAYLPQINETGCFFLNRFAMRLSEQSVRRMIQKFCLKAGILSNITPHMFRHSFATLLLEEDVDIRYIQRMLGHSSIQTTQIYTQVTAAKQRRILTAKHPRNKLAFGQ